MNFIQDIQTAETEADKKITQAKETASSIIDVEQKKQTEEISTLETHLKEEELARKNEQKKKLTELYKKIIKKGEKEVEQVKENTEKTQTEAVKFVFKNLLTNK